MFTMGCGGSRRLRWRAVHVVLATLALLAATTLFSPAPSRADTGYPVLLVHGGLGHPDNFGVMKLKLQFDRYRTDTVQLSNYGIDIVKNANEISDKVNEMLKTGAMKVHLVGHSMGGLSTRYYIKFLGGIQKVASYTAFGSSQHGHPPGCASGIKDQCPTGPVLTELNRDDDTPGPIHYTSIASKQAPAEADGKWHPLDQGACLRLVDGGSHLEEPFNEVIYDAVKDGLNSTCPTGWTNLPEITP